jgi:hypothetical protein
LQYEKLTEKDRIQVKYVQECIHGLSLGDNKAMDQHMVDVIVQRFYNAYRMDNNSVIAYKGGSFEKTLLDKLNIPSFNLELLGYPKAINIYHEMAWLECCGQHTLLKNKNETYKHCPRVEVEAYLHWFTNK